VEDSNAFTVGTALSASITTSPSPVIINQPVTFSATPEGDGTAPYTYAWDLTDSGTFTPATGSTPFEQTTTFTTLGEHTVRLQIKDTVNGGNIQHTAIVTQTVDVVEPTTNTPPPPPPPTCYPSLVVGLAHLTTTGCFTQSTTNPSVYTTRSTVMLNGGTLTAYGQTFTVTTAPDGTAGHFTAPNSTIEIGGTTVFSGNIDWTLPVGGAGDQALAESFTVATGYQFLNLSVAGTVSLTLGENSDGTFYSDYGLYLQLPAGFSAGPDPSFGSVSGGVAIKVEDSGKVDFGGIVLNVQNVWMGSLQVENACFAYVPADGNQGNGCPAVSATSNDAPIVSCNTNPDASYWAASVTVDLPSGVRLGASGSIVGGQVGSFSGVLGNLGRTVPITAGFFLDHIAFGMCLNPPPLTIAANVGVNFLGSTHAVDIEGGFTYTDSTESTPWSIEINGAVSVGDTPIGTAEVGFDGNEVINFDVQAGFTALDNIASLNGEVYGWIDAPEKEWVVGGDIKGCFGSACAEAEGEFSSTGVAGCITIGSTFPTYDLIIPLDGSGPPYLDQSVYPITAGFGYVWGNKTVDLLGGSCDFSDYEPADAFSARAANGDTRLSTKVASGTEAVALRIHGTNGPPQIVVHGPGGVTITSPAKGITKQSKGHYMLIENKTNGTADLMLIRPAAGTWTVSQAPHSTSSLTTMDRASLEVPPTFGARIKTKGARRVVQVAYAVPVGAKVKLVEHAKGVEHTIAANLQGQRCPGLPAMRPHTDERILCANIRFTPSLGQTRKRQIVAVVSRGAIPLYQKAIASFTAPALRLPSRVAAMRVQRGQGDLVVDFSSSSPASHYAVSAKLSDGRELAYYLGARCHALKITNVPAGVGAAVKLAGVRYDLKLGRANTISINADAKSAGKKSKKLKKGRVCS
jgi:PKD domain